LLELSSGQLANRFTDDVQVGMAVRDAAGSAEVVANEAGLAVRAGVLKAGIGYWGWTAFQRRVLAAVADAHARTGAPVMVHLEHGSAAFELLEVLASDGVCDLRRCSWRMLTATPIPACTPSSPPLAHTLDMTGSPAPATGRTRC
jgi:predicted metal-dependent phosphotriesterase family hydrolase